jgi:glycosyltransferase involved in cell wall biosynthesis
VTLNRVKTIGLSIDSVHNQTYRNIEHIVIDGNSIDGTKKIISDKLTNKDKFISENDEGIYDAINKGLKIASGDIIGILHSDDIYYHNSIIDEISYIFLQNPEIDIVYGDIVFVNSLLSKKIIRYYNSSRFSYKNLKWGWMPAHPSVFMKKAVYDKFGFYKTQFKISSDFEFMCRIFKDDNLKTYYLKKPLIKMLIGGRSTNGLKSTILLNKEVKMACELNGIKTNYLKLYSKYFLKIFEFISWK